MTGAGYDISPSHANAASLAANQAAGTIINFGDRAQVDGGRYDLGARATASASAAKQGASAAAETYGTPGGNNPPNWSLIAAVAGAAVIIAAAIYLKN
jgi:hypothetical protein